MSTSRNLILVSIAGIAVALLFLALILTGPVDISPREAMAILFGSGDPADYRRVIVMESRLPMALAAACCGSSLAVAGLVMQATFQNPLAGPSVLGVSSGASLGVAVVMLGATAGLPFISTGMQSILSVGGALVGAAAVTALLAVFSSVLRNGVMLLIVGMMLSYVSSSLISLLNFFAPAEGVRSYMLWGLGSFSGVRIADSGWLLFFTASALFAGLFYIKPLNALLLGERYASSMGYSMKRLRLGLLCVAGLQVGVPTAFCGPIGFIGLVAPHICRLVLRSSNHAILYPACILAGAALAMACALLSVLPASSFGVIPINVITPLIGVPVIIYILVNRDRILYFN